MANVASITALRKLKSPGLTVRLSPGIYEVGEELALPERTTIVAVPGTVWFRRAVGAKGRMFRPAPGLRMFGLTADVGGESFMTGVAAPPHAAGLRMERCHLLNGSFGECPRPDAIFEGCTFERFGFQAVYERQSYLRCEWRGLAPGGLHAMQVRDAGYPLPWFPAEYVGEVSFTDCAWRGTDRGVVLQAQGGNPKGVRGVVVERCLFSDIAWVGNGNEAVLAECPNADCRFVGLRFRGCEGPAILFYGDTTRATVRDIRAHGGQGILNILGRGRVTDSAFSRIELTGGGVFHLGDGSTGNVLENVWVHDPRPTLGNGHEYPSGWSHEPILGHAGKCLAPRVAIRVPAGNRTERCGATGLAEGWTEFA